jgi:hypothetical protein
MRMKSLMLAVLATMVSLASQAQEAGDVQTFHVDSDSSWLRVLAYPDGPLKRFGHHHVISHHGISGTVDLAPDPLDSTFKLEIAVEDLVVDDAEMRALEGEDFEDEVPQKDIDGTRGNMLGERLLNGEQFPTIQLKSASIEGSMPDVNIVTTVSVIGVESTVRFPASIQLTDDSLVATGELEITHGELGLSPFTAMGGAMSVRDAMVFKYRISANRTTGSN